MILDVIRAFTKGHSVNINGFVLSLFYSERMALERREIALR